MTQERSSTALQAACLAATLVTAFADAPAQASATVGPDFSTTGPGSTSVYDATYAYNVINGSGVSTIPYNRGLFPPKFLIPNGAGIIVFTQSATNIATYQTEDFNSAFPNADEGQVLAYLSGASSDGTSYFNFVNDIYGQDALDSSLPSTGILFSQGKYAGILSAGTYANHPGNTFALFGVAPEPTPEPGAVAALSLGTVGLAGLRLRARRRR